MSYPITCANCGKVGTHADVGRPGTWMLAANRPFGYSCCKACDDALTGRRAVEANDQ